MTSTISTADYVEVTSQGEEKEKKEVTASKIEDQINEMREQIAMRLSTCEFQSLRLLATTA